MVMHGVELIMSRRQIQAMIDADPIEVILWRRTKEKTAANGWKWTDPQPLPAQKVRITPFKRRLTDILTNTELGEVVNAPYVLLGRHDADVKREDVFEWAGRKFVIDSFDIAEPEVKTAALVQFHGGGNNG